MNPHRNQFPLCDLPLDIRFFAIPALCLHQFAVLQSHHGLRAQNRDNPLTPALNTQAGTRFSARRTTRTLVFLSSAVVSSNGSLSLNLISVVLKVLWDFMHTIPCSSTVTIKLGLVRFPTCRVANPTPAEREHVNASHVISWQVHELKLPLLF